MRYILSITILVLFGVEACRAVDPQGDYIWERVILASQANLLDVKDIEQSLGVVLERSSEVVETYITKKYVARGGVTPPFSRIEYSIETQRPESIAEFMISGDEFVEANSVLTLWLDPGVCFTERDVMERVDILTTSNVEERIDYNGRGIAYALSYRIGGREVAFGYRQLDPKEKPESGRFLEPERYCVQFIEPFGKKVVAGRRINMN